VVFWAERVTVLGKERREVGKQEELEQQVGRTLNPAADCCPSFAADAYLLHAGRGNGRQWELVG
jgi:hypothetical protein